MGSQLCTVPLEEALNLLGDYEYSDVHATSTHVAFATAYFNCCCLIGPCGRPMALMTRKLSIAEFCFDLRRNFALHWAVIYVDD